MASKYTEEYIQKVLNNSAAVPESNNVKSEQSGSKYTEEYIQGVLDRGVNQTEKPGPLSIKEKESSGQMTTASAPTPPEVTGGLYQNPEFVKEIKAQQGKTGKVDELLEYGQNQLGNSVKSVLSILNPWGDGHDYSADYAEKWKKEHNKEQTPVEEITDPIKKGAEYVADLAGYTAAQAVNSIRGVGSVLMGDGTDYASDYAEKWKKDHNTDYTPLEDVTNLVGRNVYAGLGQAQGGIAKTADMILPDPITPKPVQEGLDFLKESTDAVNSWANEFNDKTEKGVSADLLQVMGGMIPDLALAAATGGASAVSSIPKAASSKPVSEIVQQAVENPQFWLTFSRTWGDSYEEAKARGASEEQALAASALSSLLNAQIEIGGGVQTQFAEGAEKGLKGLAKSALEEGAEEVKQNLVTNGTNKMVFDTAAPFASGTDETAVFNPYRDAKSFAMGALAGGLMSVPGAIPTTRQLQKEVTIDESHPDVYNQGKGVIENEPAVQMGGDLSADPEELHRGGSIAEYQSEGTGNGVPATAGEERQGSASANTAIAEEITGRSVHSPYTRQLRDLYDRLDRGEVDGEEMGEIANSIAIGVVRKEDFEEEVDPAIVARKNYLKNTKIFITPEERTALLDAFGGTNLGQFNMKFGTRFTSVQKDAIPLDVAIQEMSGEGFGISESNSPIDDVLGVINSNQEGPLLDEDMLLTQQLFVKDKIMRKNEGVKSFEDWLQECAISNEWGAAPDYVERVAQRYGFKTGFVPTEDYVLPDLTMGENVRNNSPSQEVDPYDLDSLYKSDPLLPPLDSNPIDMDALYESDLQQQMNPTPKETMLEEPDPYGIAGLFRSDPESRGLSEQAQMDAQTSLHQYENVDELKKLAGLTGDAVKDTFASHPITSRVNFGYSAAEIREAENNKKALQKEWNMYRSASNATRAEETDAKQIAAGEKELWQISAGSRPEVVRNLVDIQTRITASAQTGLQAQKRNILEEQQAIFKGVLSDITDPAELVTKENTSIAKLNKRTPERVLRYVFGDRMGRQLSDLLITPIHHNESAKVQFINQMFDEARKLDLNLVERKLVQLVGEGTKGKNGSAITIGDIENRNITEESLPGHITKSDRDYILRHLEKADPKKVEAAVSFYRQCYDSIREVVNDFRLEHGLTEIGKQENYFPHFSEDDPLTKTLKQLGLEGASGLPTSISGETAWFRPNSRYVTYFQARTGPETTYDSDLGFQSYVNAVADMLYHTDDIMRLRNFDAVIRGKSKEVDIANTIDSILGKKNLPLTENEISVMDKILQGEYMDMEASKNYSTFAQWLTNYTNKLANKQLFGDRWVEEKFGRLAFNLANKIESHFAQNSVVGNITSALNNTITLPKIFATTEQKYVVKAISGIKSNELKNLAAESEFLQGKKGVRQLVESPTQKAIRCVSEKVFDPVEEAVSDVAFYAKYLEQLDKNGGNTGLAALEANEYAANMMARRSKGARPLDMESKDPFGKLFTMFQTELSNDWYSLVQDLPDYVKQQAQLGNKEQAAQKIVAGAVKYTLYSYALNTLLEAITGYAPAPDPLRWLWEFGTALFDEEKEENAALRTVKAVGGLTGEVLNQVPGASTAMALLGLDEGRVPLPDLDMAQAGRGVAALFDDPEESPNKYGYAAEQLWNGVVKPGMFYAVLPFGGNQLRKTIEGANVLVRGGAYQQTKTGEKLQTIVNSDVTTSGGLANVLKGLAFGKSAINEVGHYYDNGGRPKSEQYTAARKAGYSDELLEQLFPSSDQSVGNVNYEKLTGGAEGSAEVDTWLNELADSTGRRSVLPRNTVPTIQKDGETEKLNGKQQMEYAETKQTVSYDILTALLPVADRVSTEVQTQYAVMAQEYAAEMAKETVARAGSKKTNWIAEVQEQSGVSGTEVTDELVNTLLARAIIMSAESDKAPNGSAIIGSKKRKAKKALQDAGFSAAEAERLYNRLK